MKTAPAKSAAKSVQVANGDPIGEILDLIDEVTTHIRRSCYGALRIGLRLIALHRATGESDAPGGFRAALTAIEGKAVSAGTAYRWMNATSMILCQTFDETDIAEVFIPEIGTEEWINLEAVLQKAGDGMSLRRLALGFQNPQSDIARLDRLTSTAEEGDPAADAMLKKVLAGELTLAQAIRGAAGAAVTKGKHRRDPVYLDIDSTTGQPTGLVPKCLVTLGNAFSTWGNLDPTARQSIRESWKALVAKLPKELR